MTNNQENQTTGQTAAQGKATIFRATRRCVKHLRRKARKEARRLERAAKAQFDKEAAAAVIIQCCARKYFCYQICLDLVLDHMFMCDVLLIQRFVRGAIARRNLADAAAAAAAATVIQRVVRGAVARAHCAAVRTRVKRTTAKTRRVSKFFGTTTRLFSQEQPVCPLHWSVHDQQSAEQSCEFDNALQLFIRSLKNTLVLLDDTVADKWFSALHAAKLFQFVARYHELVDYLEEEKYEHACTVDDVQNHWVQFFDVSFPLNLMKEMLTTNNELIIVEANDLIGLSLQLDELHDGDDEEEEAEQGTDSVVATAAVFLKPMEKEVLEPIERSVLNNNWSLWNNENESRNENRNENARAKNLGKENANEQEKENTSNSTASVVAFRVALTNITPNNIEPKKSRPATKTNTIVHVPTPEVVRQKRTRDYGATTTKREYRLVQQQRMANLVVWKMKKKQKAEEKKRIAQARKRILWV
jgi:hypothetical protein